MYKNNCEFCIEFSGLQSPDFTITMTSATTITVQISGRFGFHYQLNSTLQENGEKISTNRSDRLQTNLETIPIENLYPFTTYKIELQVRRSDTAPWSYPASRVVKTLEEGIII